MRLSDAELQWMQTRLAQRYAAAGSKAREALERKLAALPPDQSLLTSWCYAASPLSDWANYDFSLFSACAAHALFLREQSPEVRALPEQLFLNYVLHPRVNEEELCDCRGAFYAQLEERIRGLSAREAILAINFWNAEQVCYRATDARPISALGAQVARSAIRFCVVCIYSVFSSSTSCASRTMRFSSTRRSAPSILTFKYPSSSAEAPCSYSTAVPRANSPARFRRSCPSSFSRISYTGIIAPSERR